MLMRALTMACLVTMLFVARGAVAQTVTITVGNEVIDVDYYFGTYTQFDATHNSSSQPWFGSVLFSSNPYGQAYIDAQPSPPPYGSSNTLRFAVDEQINIVTGALEVGVLLVNDTTPQPGFQYEETVSSRYWAFASDITIIPEIDSAGLMKALFIIFTLGLVLRSPRFTAGLKKLPARAV